VKQQQIQLAPAQFTGLLLLLLLLLSLVNELFTSQSSTDLEKKKERK
jgi:hypothetical protein